MKMLFGNTFPATKTGATNRNSIKYCRKTANISVKNFRFITTYKAHRSSHVQNGKTLISST